MTNNMLPSHGTQNGLPRVASLISSNDRSCPALDLRPRLAVPYGQAVNPWSPGLVVTERTFLQNDHPRLAACPE